VIRKRNPGFTVRDSGLQKSLLNEQFNLGRYEDLVLRYGLSSVWDELLDILTKHGIDFFEKNYVDFYDIGRLYEIGLAVENKYSKKEAGKYYTPKDVSQLMADLLIENERLDAIADVGCGCGNLVIEVLQKVKDRSAEEFGKLANNIYLYDLDKTAINICKTRISVLFSIDDKNIHACCGDYLNGKVKMPSDCFVISNPPYSQIKDVDKSWGYKVAIKESKDLYVGFIEKMIRTSEKAVIVSPQSYIVGTKFKKIRELLYQLGSGEIYSFDNVPGTLFNGRKQGVFNTNTANGVRASILVFNKTTNKGYRLTHLIRFRTDEREKVIKIGYVKKQLGSRIQDLKKPLKCFRELESFVGTITGNKTIKDLLSIKENKYCINVNSSARYFIVGSAKKLNRNGSFELYAKDEESFYLLYALLNSSYAYLWWRMLDGGILIPKSLLIEIPLPSIFNFDNSIVQYCKKLINDENKHLVYKKNAGAMQESIKFPVESRNKLNQLMFGDIPFELIHSNKEFF